MMKLLTLTAAILLSLQACNLTTPTRPPRPPQSTEPSAQRFVPITSPSPLFDGMQPAHFALDTATGRLCKSWEWNAPQNELNALPVCYSLTRVEVWERGPGGEIRK